MAEKLMARYLDPKRLGLAAGVLWGLTIFSTTLIASATTYGKAFLESYGSLHPGYSITATGSVVGLIYAFICAFVGMYVLAWLYNWLGEKT